jgi:hypothetical protein
MYQPTAIALTSNGRHAYVTALGSSAVVVFARDKKTGALTQLAAPHGCVSAYGDGVTCTGAIALTSVHAIAMPNSAKHVYVSTYGGDSVVAFAREN